MEGSFHGKVRAAAIAAWWTLLVAVVVHIIQSVVCLVILHNHPAWLTAMLGGITWDTLQTLILWVIVVLRITIWLMLIAAVWLTIWAAKLKHVQ